MRELESKKTEYISALENCLRIWGTLAAYRDINPILSELTVAEKAVKDGREAVEQTIRVMASQGQA